MSQSQTEGYKIAERLKAQSKNLNCDTKKFMERYVSEQVISGLIMTLKSKFIAGGGCIHPQTLRETGDADVKFIRRHSEAEFKFAFEGMTGFLDKMGIRLEPVGDAIVLDIHSASGLRFNYRAWIGGSRVDTHIDISFGDGRSTNFPPVWGKALPQLCKGAPICTVPCQVPETQAAEKMATILTRAADDTRLKDYADIAMIAMSDSFDSDLFAEELGRVLADRRISSSVLVAHPVGMSSTFALENQAGFSAYQLKNRRMVGDLKDVVGFVKRTYDRARETALRQLLSYAPEHAVDISSRLRPARPSARKVDGKVVDLEAYRHTMPRM